MTTDPTTLPPTDPKLVGVMEVIKQLLLVNDIAGEVVLVSPTHAEFLHHFTETSWSALTWDYSSPGKTGIRFKVKPKTGNTTVERARAEATVHMISQFRARAADTFAIHDRLWGLVNKHLKIDVLPERFTPRAPDEPK